MKYRSAEELKAASMSHLTAEEFKDWFAKEHNRPRCGHTPSHLVGSYECNRMHPRMATTGANV